MKPSKMTKMHTIRQISIPSDYSPNSGNPNDISANILCLRKLDFIFIYDHNLLEKSCRRV